MRLFIDLPISIGQDFRFKTISNFKSIIDAFYLKANDYEKHKQSETHAHNAIQIDYKNSNVSSFLDFLRGEIEGLVVGANGDGIAEVKETRVSIDGTVHPLLQSRLLHDFGIIGDKINKEINSSTNSDYLWTPPTVPSFQLGQNNVPIDWNPEKHLDAFFNPLVDNVYVRKKVLGKDESKNHNVYQYTFEPENYTKTLLLTACIHGNETTGFFDLCYLLDLLVNKWYKYPHLTYIRKNVRLIVVPMVNPWGFANQKRNNVNNVDLNRNFDYNWESGKGTNPNDSNFKGTKAFSESETKLMRDLVQKTPDITAHLDLHDIISVKNDYCIFYPRWGNQENNRLSELINSMKKKGEYVVWGSSTLSSFSNWVSIKMKKTSYLSEINEGRLGEKKNSAEMTRTVRWVSNVIFKLLTFPSTQNGQTSNDPFLKVFVYDEKFSDKNASKITLRSERNSWQRILMSQQRFKATANGFVEMYGQITFNVDRDVTVGINPNIVQNYHPYFNAGKSKERNLFTIEHEMNKGNTTIPIHAAAGVQMSNIVDKDIKRTNEILPLIDVKKKGEGVVRIKQIKIFVKFTPSSSADSIQVLQSGKRGNLKEDTFNQIYPNSKFSDNIRNDINK